MSLNRWIRTGSATTLAALSLVACSGGPPDGASVEDFCDTWSDNRGGTLEEVHEFAQRLEEVGTPEDVDDTERAGFEVFVDVLAEVDQEHLDALDEAVAEEASLAEVYGISEDAGADIVTFFDYANRTCHGADSQSTD